MPKKLTIEEIQQIAAQHGGKCLSETYINNRTKLLWQCAEGHRWERIPKIIKQGRWCPECANKQSTETRRRLGISEMQQIAEEHGGKCLSKTYINGRTKLLWKCAKGHQWDARPENVKRGIWCLQCAGKAKGTLEEMQQIATQRGGKCLSESYVHALVKLLWECAEGHQWEATPNSIKNGGSWCRKCAGLAKGTIEEMQAIAQKRGGKCLSKTYVNSQTKLLWQCAEGHQWPATPGMIKSGTWCRKCSSEKRSEARRLGIEEMQQIAAERGGKCLSETYVNTDTKLLWECAEGHQWEAIPDSVKNREYWCPHCAGKAKLTIEEMQQIAMERGGKCLSEMYVNSKTKLLWECAEGHQWEVHPNSIKSGQWCPECSSGLGERICRVFFEQLFENKFPKRYPKWLVNQDGNRMELDGYCQSLKLAFEHQGEQHYSTKTHFITTEDALQKRQEDDKFKKTLCVQRGIVLIEVPEIPTRLPIKEVKAFIRSECERYGIPLPLNFDAKRIDLKRAYATSGAKEALKELQVIAVERGGKCLSDRYISSNTKLLWQCSKGHQWEATPADIKNGGHWCQKCYDERRGKARRLGIEEMQQIAAEHGGKCLSENYVNTDTKLLWECAEGHQWEAIPDSVKNREYWCPHCADKTKLTIEEMQQIAAERGGKCLSESYVNNKTKLLWECVEGHQWSAKPDSIKNGRWCRKCSSKKHGEARRLGIEEMRQIAEQRGGKCLSKTYTNNRTKLLWECAEGHQWPATPNHIKWGKWCPYCGGSMKRSIEEMRRIAEQRGGKCLSETYTNNRTKLLWECAEGHQWPATPGNTKTGYWCPYCTGTVRGTIEEMQQIAGQRGGKCLSETYINNKTKLLWQCAEGHRWERTPKVIKQGRWCPECARLRRDKRR